MNPLIVSNLKKYYLEKGKTVKAVDDVSFSVNKGEIFGLLGPNGAGKSTTINILTGLLSRDSGTIKILGSDPEHNWEFIKPKTNVSSAYFPLTEVLTVKQNLKVYAKLYGVKNYKEKIDYLLTKLELQKKANTRVIKLSSGERTRTSLCKGLINDPEVLFLDEATSGLDPDIAEKTRSTIKEYQEKYNTTILFTSHYMYEVEELCERIAFMSNGKIITVGTSKELKKLIKDQTIEISVIKQHAELKKFLKQEGVDILFAKDKTLIFQVSAGEQDTYKILNKIFKQGFKLSDLHIKKPTLDDIFIKIAREK
jgi:ABC-2 type transport system ATP-binding protein